MTDDRAYPERPFLAVSAAIIRNDEVLVVRRARPPAHDLFSLPGGLVMSGETLMKALQREVREETSLAIEPIALAGFREIILHDADGRAERHFVVLAFAARWLGGEPRLNDELSEARWLRQSELAGLPTTEGLADIVAQAFERMEQS